MSVSYELLDCEERELYVCWRVSGGVADHQVDVVVRNEEQMRWASKTLVIEVLGCRGVEATTSQGIAHRLSHDETEEKDNVDD